MYIIPAIDIIDGKCVRLTKGDYDQKKVYNDSPLEVAKEFEDYGIKRLHLVDLDGAKASHIVNYKVLESIANKTNLAIDFGGGIKTDEDIRIAFDAGAAQITGGSIAVKNPEIFKGWLKSYGSEKIILGADVKKEKIAINGWKEETSENLFDFIKGYQAEGAKYVICTDIDKDGVLQGPSIDLYKKIQEKFPEIQLVASGGVTTMKDVEELKEMNVFGAIIGKAIYEGRISLKEIEQYNLSLNS